jgi:hypothetical protein
MEKMLYELIKRLDKLENEVRAIRRDFGNGRAVPLPSQSLLQNPLPSAEKSMVAVNGAKRDRDFYSKLLAQTLIDMGYSGG